MEQLDFHGREGWRYNERQADKPSLELAYKGLLISVSEGYMTREQLNNTIVEMAGGRPPLGGELIEEVKQILLQSVKENRISLGDAKKVFGDWLTEHQT